MRILARFMVYERFLNIDLGKGPDGAEFANNVVTFLR
jgi:hypothetical protein